MVSIYLQAFLASWQTYFVMYAKYVPCFKRDALINARVKLK